MKPTPSARPSLVARARGWVGRPLGRGVLALCGLAVLSLVGRFAVAGAQVAPVASSALSAIAPLPMTPTQAIDTLANAASALDASTPTPAASHTAASADDPVVLNEATVEDLRRLPSIGEKRALAILELRKKLGRFKQIEDLLRVKGIGRSTLRRLRPLVRVDSPKDGGLP